MQILFLVSRTINRVGVAPTYSEIGEELGMRRSDVCNAVRRLEGGGLIERRTDKERKFKGWHEPVITLTAAAKRSSTKSLTQTFKAEKV